MMGQALAKLDCGIVEALIGDPDWVIDRNGVRPSDTRVQRDRERTIAELRSKIVEREQRIQTLERDVNSIQDKAIACSRLLKNGGLSLAQQQAVKQRAKIALRTMTDAQKEMRELQTIVAVARQTLDRLDRVERTDKDRELFVQLHELTNGVNLDESRFDDLTDAGTNVLESNAMLDEFGQAMGSVVDLFDASLAESDTLGGLEFDLNKDDDLMRALNQLERTEPLGVHENSTAWSGAVAGATSVPTAQSATFNWPSSPQDEIKTNNNRGPSNNSQAQLTQRQKRDEPLESVFF